MIRLNVALTHLDAKIPEKATGDDSGFDVFVLGYKKAYVTHPGSSQEEEVKADENMHIPGITDDQGNLWLNPNDRVLVRTGLAMAVESDDGKIYELQVRPRSGNTLKEGLSVLNSPGTVDAGYRGEVMVIISNQSGVAQQISVGDKIAQVVPIEVPMMEVNVVESLDASERGSKGFGDSGK